MSDYRYDSTTTPVANQFMYQRQQVWLGALGPEPHGTLAEMQCQMPGWPLLFAWHCFTATVLLATNNGQDSDGVQVWLDQWRPWSVLSPEASMSVELEKLTAIPP